MERSCDIREIKPTYNLSKLGLELFLNQSRTRSNLVIKYPSPTSILAGNVPSEKLKEHVEQTIDGPVGRAVRSMPKKSNITVPGI